VAFADPDQDPKGNITLTELTNTSLPALVNLNPTAASLSGTLPVTATLGSYTASGTPTITISSTNVFGGAAPTVVVNADFNELLNFNRLLPADFNGLFAQMANALQGIAGSLNPVGPNGGSIPFVDQTLNNVLDYGKLMSTFGRGVYDPVSTGSADAPVNGQLSGDAIFTVSLDGATAISVTVAQSATTSNANIDDLVKSINNALPSSLNRFIQAGHSGNRIKLTATDASVMSFTVQVSDPANAAVRDLGFGQFQNSQPVFKFDTIQALQPLLASIMGITSGQVNPQYDPATHSLSFAVNLQNASFANFSQTVPIDFAAGIGPLTVNVSANASFSAGAGTSPWASSSRPSRAC
jgi:hypothetical protein